MPFKVAGKGNYRIDRIFPFESIGRIQISSGTTDDKKFKAIQTMMDSLSSDGRTDDLDALKKKVITPLEALAKWKTGTLKGGDTLKLAANLSDSILPWLKGYDIADTQLIV